LRARSSEGAFDRRIFAGASGPDVMAGSGVADPPDDDRGAGRAARLALAAAGRAAGFRAFGFDLAFGLAAGRDAFVAPGRRRRAAVEPAFAAERPRAARLGAGGLGVDRRVRAEGAAGFRRAMIGPFVTLTVAGKCRTF
jgi:hypothetical protein